MIDIDENSALALIAKERDRQINEEGFDATHDDDHAPDGLPRAAAAYMISAASSSHSGGFRNLLMDIAETIWPWEAYLFKPSGGVKDLVRAGALVLAAIDRENRNEPFLQNR